MHFTREPGESHIGRTCHPLFFLKREGGVTSSRVRRRRFNDTGTPAGIPLEGLQRGPARRDSFFFTPALPDNFLTLLVYRLIERRTFHSFEMAAFYKNKKQFLAVDHSARASMKNAASCEN